MRSIIHIFNQPTAVPVFNVINSDNSQNLEVHVAKSKKNENKNTPIPKCPQKKWQIQLGKPMNFVDKPLIFLYFYNLL